MNLESFTGPGSTPSRRRLWDKVQRVVLSCQKLEGKNISVDVREGLGSVINVPSSSPGRGGTPHGGGAVACDSFTPAFITLAGITIDCCIPGPEFSGFSNRFHDCIPGPFCMSINQTFPLTPFGGNYIYAGATNVVGNNALYFTEDCSGDPDSDEADSPFAITVGCNDDPDSDFGLGWWVQVTATAFYFFAYGIANPTVSFANQGSCGSFDPFGNQVVGDGGTGVLS